LEQHVPNVEPAQVYPVPDPQVPDGVTAKLVLDFLGAATAVAVEARRRIFKKFKYMVE